MSKKTDAHLAQAMVLLDRQYRMLERLYGSCHTALRQCEKAISQQRVSLNHVIDVYYHVLGLIDNFARYQKIAFSIPRQNQKSREYRSLISALGDIKDARDQLQHLNNDIDNDNSGPLLGGITWTEGKYNYMIGFHDVGRSRSSPGIPFDTHTQRYVSEFCFTYGDKYYDLSQAMKGVEAFNSHLTNAIRIEIDGQPYQAEKHFAALTVAVLTEAEVLALSGSDEGSSISET